MLLQLRETSPKVLRRENLIPGVIYGKGFDSAAVKVEERAILNAYRRYGQSITFEIEFAGEKHQVYIKEIQFELFNNTKITHFDLMKVSADTLLTADIPIIVHGREEIEEQRLFVEMVMQTIPARYPATVTLANFEIDVTDFELNQSFAIEDLEIDEQIEILAEPDQMILIVKEPEEFVEEELDVEEDVDADDEEAEDEEAVESEESETDED